MIPEQIIQIVHDAVEFQNSELGQELKDSNHPPQYWKWVKIHSHRRAGYTTVALMLLEQYTSSLIVTPTYNIAHHVRRMAIDENLAPSIDFHLKPQSSLFDHLVPASIMTTSWFRNRNPEQRHQLIILDPASMIEDQRGRDMDEFRHELFMLCDVLVELS